MATASLESEVSRLKGDCSQLQRENVEHASKLARVQEVSGSPCIYLASTPPCWCSAFLSSPSCRGFHGRPLSWAQELGSAYEQVRRMNTLANDRLKEIYKYEKVGGLKRRLC